MKNLAFNASVLISKLSLSIAFAGAGLTSYLGWHQPKVPTRISK